MIRGVLERKIVWILPLERVEEVPHLALGDDQLSLLILFLVPRNRGQVQNRRAPVQFEVLDLELASSPDPNPRDPENLVKRAPDLVRSRLLALLIRLRNPEQRPRLFRGERPPLDLLRSSGLDPVARVLPRRGRGLALDQPIAERAEHREIVVQGLGRCGSPAGSRVLDLLKIIHHWLASQLADRGDPPMLHQSPKCVPHLGDVAF